MSKLTLTMEVTEELKTGNVTIIGDAALAIKLRRTFYGAKVAVDDFIQEQLQRNICTDPENDYNKSSEKYVSKQEATDHYDRAIVILKKRVEIIKKTTHIKSYCIDTDILNKI